MSRGGDGHMQTDETDVIIVGSGPAGSVIAARLSERSDLKVDVIEAGPSDRHLYIHVPAGFIKMIFNPTYTWPFKTEPSSWTGGREINVLQGKVVGGSSSINGLIYNRGQAADFDQWAQMGNSGWDYASVLPYFVKSEAFSGKGDVGFHGRSGPLQTSEFDWHHPLCDLFINGAQELGIPRNDDYNGKHQEGVGYFQRIIRGRRRISAARAFLIPALKRGNLHLRANCVVSRVLFDNKKAIGVEYITGGGKGERRKLLARKQVVLCSGTINTPRLLQMSGVGALDDLGPLGVPVVSALPGVGRNLRDHYSARVVVRAKNIRTINELAKGPRLLGEISRWLLGRPRILTLSPSLIHIFAKSSPDLDLPDLQGVFSPASYKAGFVSLLDDYPGMTCGFWQHRPESTGYVRAKSTDPMIVPHIQPNYLTETHDRDVLVAGIKLARKLLRTTPLQAFFDFEQLPGKDVQSDDEILDFATRYGVSSWHLVGTSKMGPATDPHAVVDSRLQVYGFENLRIADASIMPVSPSANTFAATVMIGEKAADYIKQDLGIA
jgi:choline dehydrogenase